MSDMEFSERVALISGGTSGIGLATARAFARAGAAVALIGRDVVRGERAAEQLAACGAHASFIRADVREAHDVERAVDRTVAQFGRLDFVSNNAGVGGDLAPLPVADQTVWDDVMAINARGVWLCMRYAIPAMLRTGGGAVVNMSSIYGVTGRAAHHAYVASKHAVVGMTRSVALEYASQGVRINAICAGVTRTSAMADAEALMPEIVRGLVSQHPIGRMAEEAEIAETVLWLCSDRAGYVTGALVAVDGGFSAQ